MASSGNFGTWNPLADYSTGTTFSNGHCTTALSQQNQYRAVLGPAIPDSGKWYFEFFIDYQTAGFPSVIGVLDGTINSSLSTGNYLSNAGSFHIEPMTGKLYSESTTGTSYTGNSGSPAATGNADAKVGIAFDRDNNKLWFAVNNNWINVGSGVGDPATDSNPAVSSIEENLSICHGIRQATGTSKVVINCGQDSTFGGLATAGGNADGNGFGDFFYTPPSGFLALCSANLPISTNIDPAETDNDIPTKQFGAETFTGNGGTQTIQLGDGFQPDLVITKNTGSTNSWIVLDSSRGYNKTLKLEEPDAEGTNSYVGYGIESDFFASTGIKANDGGSPGFNNSTANYIVYGWRANGGTTSTNTSGTITTTVQANTAAGFSILTYTGTGSNATLGHGLSQAPDTIWFKNRDQNDSWLVYLNAAGLGNNKFVLLDSHVGSSVSGTAYLQATSPSSTVISVGDEHKLNASGEKYVAYCWHNVDGYSKFGQFTGNGSTDGPYVYTGFRPRFYMYISLRFSGSPHWEILDTARGTVNPVSKILQADVNSAEYTDAARNVDFLSSGIKVRASDSYDANSSSGMAYWIWGDVPFKYNNTRQQQ